MFHYQWGVDKDKRTLLPDPLLTDSEVSEVTSVSRSARYEMIREGKFPKPVQVSQCRVAWRSTHIQAWIDALPVADAYQDVSKGSR
jgi:prophage regulatory protein